jgi:hypothetical protein
MGRWDKKAKDYTVDEIVKNKIHFDDPEEEIKAIHKVAQEGTKLINEVLDAMEHNDCNLYKHQ